ncbi:hypothetical protein [Nostoc sp.]|uniref:hypothetical protein n=1 Tax=Nostoc sp. TaxID=1180 RepID=UPI002FF75699
MTFPYFGQPNLNAYVFAISAIAFATLAIAPPTLLIWKKCRDNQWTMPNELYSKLVAYHTKTYINSTLGLR